MCGENPQRKGGLGSCQQEGCRRSKYGSPINKQKKEVPLSEGIHQTNTYKDPRSNERCNIDVTKLVLITILSFLGVFREMLFFQPLFVGEQHPWNSWRKVSDFHRTWLLWAPPGAVKVHPCPSTNFQGEKSPQGSAHWFVTTGAPGDTWDPGTCAL